MSTPIIVSRSEISSGSESDIQGDCAVCGISNNLLRCARCNTVKYCTKEHQVLDWRNHKEFCVPNAYNSKTRVKSRTNVSGLSANFSGGQADESKYSGVSEDGILSNFISNIVGEITRIQSGDSEVEEKIEKHLAGLDNQDQPRPDGWKLPITYGGSSEDTVPEARAELLNPSLERSRITRDTEIVASDIPRIDHHHRRHRHQNGMNFSKVSLSDDNDYLQQFVHASLGSSEELKLNDRCIDLIRDMNEYGVCIFNDFLGPDLGMAILNEVQNIHSAGMFKDGQLVSNKAGTYGLKRVRSDQTTWVDGKQKECRNIGTLISKVDEIIARARRMPNNGEMANYTIHGRTEAMVACYPGDGSHFVKHVDNPNHDGRCITAIYYLNKNWDVEKNGGLLRIFPEGWRRDMVANIEPLFDRLLFFWSDRRNPHEVQPAYKTRYAITLWYLDTEERREACRI